jgi:O-acetyl-ADP-ribose deacetylase (regulator of RNase III)
MYDYTLIVGNVTDLNLSVCEGPQTILIPHVVNNVGAFNAGVALALKTKWPKVEKDYRGWLTFWQRYQRSVLGQVFASLVECTEKTTIIVVHMFAQNGIRSRQNPQPLEYPFLQSCMEAIPEIGQTFDRPFSIHCPKFGSGLSGGSWPEIEKLIRAIWCAQNIPVTVYSYRVER